MPQNAPIVLTIGTLPEGFCYPASPQALLNAFAALLGGYLPGNFGSFNIGNAVPTPDNYDKPWIRLDGSGRLDKIFVHADGAWLSPNPTPASSDALIMWQGSEGSLWSYDGGDGTDPRPTLSDGSANPNFVQPTASVGAMWMVETDLSARFPIGVGTLPSATALAIGDTGGEETHTLLVPEIPSHDHFRNADKVPEVIQVSAGSFTGQLTGGNLFGTSYLRTGPGGGVDETTTTAHNTMPPYRAVYFIKRTARQFYRING